GGSDQNPGEGEGSGGEGEGIGPIQPQEKPDIEIVEPDYVLEGEGSEEYVLLTFNKGDHGRLSLSDKENVEKIVLKVHNEINWKELLEKDEDGNFKYIPKIIPDEGYEVAESPWDIDFFDETKYNDETSVGDSFNTDGGIYTAQYTAVSSGNPNGEEEDKIDRISGIDRIETSIKVAEHKFGKAKTVIIARHDVFADALVAGPLAYALDAPILLSKPTELPAKVEAEIQRLGVKHIIIVGGMNSIDQNVENDLRKYDKDLERIKGPDRYDTSAEVAYRLKEANGGREKAVVATGVNYPDALSVGPYAAVEGMPILLVRPNAVSEKVVQSFEKLQTKTIEIAGGYASVSKELEKELPKLTRRFQGADRYATAVEIATQTNKDTVNIYLASGEVFADALVAGPAAAKDHAPILLTRRNEAPKVLKDYVEKSKIKQITIIGGQATITDECVTNLLKK
ncbi:MAG: cell wall-binding repeat-containing protein, partial [Tissierellia bacterium]|nr:cell wall-binding repeat-containing protein [Tissierellia bacterium]